MMRSPWLCGVIRQERRIRLDFGGATLRIIPGSGVASICRQRCRRDPRRPERPVARVAPLRPKEVELCGVHEAHFAGPTLGPPMGYAVIRSRSSAGLRITTDSASSANALNM